MLSTNRLAQAGGGLPVKSKMVTGICLLATLLLFLAGCTPADRGKPTCTIVFEDNSSLFLSRKVYEFGQNEDLTVSVGVPSGYRISSVNYEHYSLSPQNGSSASYDYYSLMLHQVRYSAVIRLTCAPTFSTTYHPGGGTGASIAVLEEGPHLYANTLPYRAQFVREGYLSVGWNTTPDGTGTHIGFGSRAEHGDSRHLDLYPEWLPVTRLEAFTYTRADGEITITGCAPPGKQLVLPAYIDGLPVTAIGAGAFGEVEADIVVFPPTLNTVEPGAFRSLTAGALYLFDDLQTISEDAFGPYEITRLHINAMREPVYSGSYFDTFPDKVDYLRSLREEDKIVLFSGSSARFGYDSPMLEASFPDYRVVNMGVYAYSNMLPQARILLHFMKQGDLLLSSPELDAIDTQFCGSTQLDKETFCMLEGNYDLFSLLDCREFTNVFGAFSDYQAARAPMAPRSYSDSPSLYDEDGRRQEQATYNHYGDYILYRENNTAGENFGVKRAFYNANHIRPSDWQGLNGVYDSFAAKGITVYFTYSPRSATSLSPDSTAASIAELDTLLRDRLHAEVISPIESSLMDPLYFFATDNHLSTEGTVLHTAQVIEYLRRAREGTP